MRKIKDLSIEELQRIMDEVKVLRSQGLSYGKIVKFISDEHNLKLSKATVIRWCKGTHNPFNRIRNISLEPSPELAYVIGVYLGDGSVHLKSNGRYVVKLKVIDKEFAEAFANALKKLGIGVTIGFERDSTRVDRHYVEGSNKSLFQLLTGSRKRLLSLARKYPREFLRGFFDSEGFPVISAGKSFKVEVAAVNSDLEVLEFAQEALEELGINSKISKLYSRGHRVVIRGEEYSSNVDMFILRIFHFNDVQLFAEKVGFTASRKSEKLQMAIGLKGNYPSAEAVKLWLNEYEKVGRTYVKRGKPF
ncbi:LAGLIDADG family homing endonuclease [Thermococcus pacificus]|uniref:LAGLIDADG family homing endonuclease n=1 Tax=Thermococcus pacificus TaxID=71998 RepID=UPI001E37B987|nr:LAGLIDADG family homing endonuclease [Thermococcus pacificus]